MFGKNKPASPDRALAFEAAKEAARRASFLNVATQELEGKEDRALLFRVCRASALAAGEALGKTQAEVDATISALCDADIARLKQCPPEAVQAFGEESNKIARAYLATVDAEALSAWTQKPTAPH